MAQKTMRKAGGNTPTEPCSLCENKILIGKKGNLAYDKSRLQLRYSS